MKKIQNLGILLEKLACKLLLLIAILMFGGLTYYSMRYTEILQPEEVPLTIKDNAFLNLVTFAAVTFVFLLLRILVQKKGKFNPDKAGKCLVLIMTVLITLISVLWVTICHVAPRADGASVCLIAQLLLESGDYGFMNPPAYMGFNPHLYGLLTVIQLLFRIFGVNNYIAFQYMNALCMPLLFYSGYKLLMLIYSKWEPVLYYMALFVSCLPLFLYVPFVYGEITSITFTMVLMWQVVRFCKTGRKSCFAWGTLAIVIACVMRMNSLIVLIAAGIVLVIHTCRHAKWQAALWLLVMVVAVSASDACIRAYYKNVSGNEISDGIPPISYILMGLEDGEDGPGWFSNTNYDEFIRHDYDTALTAADNTIAVKERLKTFGNDKSYAIDFFRRKILTQWNAPAYNSLYETCYFDCAEDELPKVVHNIYYNKEASVSAFMNRYQFILFTCAAIMAVTTLVKKNKAVALENHVLIIAIVGGFLFSALWEAKSRYVLPYVVYMIPLAAVGMWQLLEKINCGMEYLCRKNKKQ